MNLLQELQAAGRLIGHPRLEHVLKEANLAFTVGKGLWGLARVKAGPELYEPSDDGTWAVITAAWQDGELIDLVATSLQTKAMRRRTGLARVLGEEWIEVAYAAGCPGKLRANGFSWLGNRFIGTVILDWTEAVDILGDLSAVACETHALAQRVQRAFAGERFCPQIFVPQQPELPHAA
jgi:hypothetical protein